MKSVGAGFSIGLGCTAYLLCDNKVLGAFLFSIGLFTVMVFELSLFTGKLCSYDGSLKGIRDLAGVWIYNFSGACYAALLFLFAGFDISKVSMLCDAKMSKPWFALIALGALCNIMIYIAVMGYRKAEGFGKWLAIIFGVMTFVLCGFEHCVADMFYFLLYMTPNNILVVIEKLFAITSGNCLGAFIGAKLFGGGSIEAK